MTPTRRTIFNSFFLVYMILLNFIFEINRVKDRHVQRVTTKPQNGAMSSMEKIGYIPRDKVPVLRDTGVVGRNKPPGEDQELDLDSAAGLERLKAKDAEIDDSLGDVLKVVDNLDNISKAMNEEVSAYVSIADIFVHFIGNKQIVSFIKFK